MTCEGLTITHHNGELVLKFLDSLGEKWEHHADVLKNSEKLDSMDVQSLIGNLRNYQETKALRKEIMKDNQSSRSLALYSNKPNKSLASDSDESAKEDTDDEKYDYQQNLVESAALIVKHYHKKNDRRFSVEQNVSHKPSHSGARDSAPFKNSERKDDGKCFNS